MPTAKHAGASSTASSQLVQCERCKKKVRPVALPGHRCSPADSSGAGDERGTTAKAVDTPPVGTPSERSPRTKTKSPQGRQRCPHCKKAFSLSPEQFASHIDMCIGSPSSSSSPNPEMTGASRADGMPSGSTETRGMPKDLQQHKQAYYKKTVSASNQPQIADGSHQASPSTESVHKKKSFRESTSTEALPIQHSPLNNYQKEILSKVASRKVQQQQAQDVGKGTRNFGAIKPLYCTTCRQNHKPPACRSVRSPAYHRIDSRDSGYLSLSGASDTSSLDQERLSDFEEAEDEGEKEPEEDEVVEEEKDVKSGKHVQEPRSMYHRQFARGHAHASPSHSSKDYSGVMTTVGNKTHQGDACSRLNVHQLRARSRQKDSPSQTSDSTIRKEDQPSRPVSSKIARSSSASPTEATESQVENSLKDLPGNKHVIDTVALETKAEGLMLRADISVTEGSRPDVSPLKKFIDNEVKLLKQDSKVVAEASHNFRSKVKKALQEKTSWEWGLLNSGSYYDGTKVTRGDELDSMYFPEIPANWIEAVYTGDPPPPPEFCYLKLKPLTFTDHILQRRYDEAKSLCVDKDRPHLMSSELFREKIFKIFQAVVDDFRRAKVHPETKPGSPSFQVILKAIPREDGLHSIDVDLLPSFCLKNWLDHNILRRISILPDEDLEHIKGLGFLVVPKECKEVRDKKVRCLLWRLSFSHVEKWLTKHADTRISRACPGSTKKPTCWKPVLRILKRTLELINGSGTHKSSKPPHPFTVKLRKASELLHQDFERVHPGFKIKKFTTFQVCTLMWTEFFLTRPGVELWVEDKLPHCIDHALIQMLKMVSGRMKVDHFFVPGMDIMGEVPDSEREFLYIMFFIAQRVFRTN